MATIYLPRLVRIGCGVLTQTAEVLGQLKLSSPLIVTDAYMVSSGLASRLSEQLLAAGLSSRIFAGVEPDPTEAVIAAAVEFLAQGSHDCVIGLGGGSPIDTAKAVALLALTGGRMRDFKAPNQQDDGALPVIAIPTTAGTGSEATRFTVVTDEVSDEKMLCAGLAFLPTAAVIDYELTLTKPRRLTADTGIDSITHALEAYVSRKANPFSDFMALEALRNLWPNIRSACDDPSNASAREGMMLGAFQAGVAFSNASVALVHGMSRPIGAHFHVPHGLSNAMLLPLVTGFSAQAALPRYAACARVMRVASEGEGDQSAVARLEAALTELNADLEVPGPRAYGITEQAWFKLIPMMAEQAIASGSPANNPRIPSREEIEDLYARAYS